MARPKKATTAANLGFEATLWAAADKLRNNMDAAEYKHVVLGLIFLKYISDSFEELHAELKAEKDADPEDEDEYISRNVFWVPKSARWSFIQSKAKQPNIGKLIDDAMDAIEKENRSLKGVLPKDYARPALDKTKLGELIDLIGTIGLGDKENRSKDILGRVYEYFLTQFASAEGKNGGQFFTPQSVVRLIVDMLAPFKNARVFDPACGSGGFFVQSEKFIEHHAGKVGDISVFGQESNPTTWKLAKMNLAIRGIEADLGAEHSDSFLRDLHGSVKADFVMANPPFNMKDWGQPQLQGDKRWKYGTPPANNANFGWVQHFISHLAPNGMAGFVLANGSMSSNTSGEGDIRSGMVEDDLVDCMVALPGQLFYSTQIPVCLWFLARNKSDKKYRDRRGETLFIDARKLGTMVDRVHKELTEADIEKIVDTYHAWRGGKDSKKKYEDIQGFCHSAEKDEIKSHGYVLTPGRYVGAEEVEDDGEDFDEKMQHLTAKLKEQVTESQKLSKQIFKNLKVLGYGE
ncbi:MAG: SAM-dependent DNA methyltransferase [Spirochaetales bacterium]|nr:SAM-dependent DNA methyltransferase [Spirochaetales bacterium]